MYVAFIDFLSFPRKVRRLDKRDREKRDREEKKKLFHSPSENRSNNRPDMLRNSRLKASRSRHGRARVIRTQQPYYYRGIERRISNIIGVCRKLYTIVIVLISACTNLLYEREIICELYLFLVLITRIH